MGWQDAPVVEQPSAQPQGQASPAWMAAPAVEAPKQAGASAYEPMIQSAAQAHGVSPELVRAVVGKESDFNPKARSVKGAGGLMQIVPATAADLGVTDVYDPAQNIEAGTRYLSQLLKKYDGDQTKALAAYNWGQGNVDKFGLKVLPKETRDYTAKINAATGYKGKPEQPAPTKPGDTTIAQDLARGLMGLNRGFGDINDMGAQAVSAIVPDVVERFMDVESKTGAERVAEKEAAYQAERVRLGGEGVDLGRLTGNIVNPASLALGAGTGGAAPAAAIAGRALPTAFAKLSPKAQKLLAPMLRGAGAAAMMPVEGTDDFAIQKAKQVGVGAALGPVAEGAGRLIGKGVGRAIGAVRGELQPGPAAIQALGKEQGVQLTAGDLAPQNKMFTGIEGALENQRLPFASMSGTRATQQSQAKAAALKLLDEERAALSKVEYHGLDRLKALAASGDVRSKEAAKVLQMINDAGLDERAIMQASGNNMWLTKKLSADKAFKEVEILAGDAIVPPTSTLSAIDSALKQTSKVVDVDPGIQSLLRKWKNQLGGPDADTLDDPVQAAVRQMEGGGPAGEAIPNTYARMREFRTDIRKRLESATTNETTDASKLFLKNIAAAVEKDMDDFAKNTPGLEKANALAQKWYREQVVPYQQPKLAKALTNEDPDNIYGAFIRQQAEGRGDYAAERFFKALDNKGKQAVRYGIVKQAMANATDGERFSPTLFKKTLEDTEYKTYFRSPADRARVDRLVDLFGHLKHADPAHLEKYSPIFGGMMGMGGMGIAGAVGGAAAGAPLAAAGAVGAGVGGAKLLRWLMTSDAGKRVLFSKDVLAKGGSKESAGQLLDKVMRQFSTATGTTAGAETGQPGRVLP